jgi:transposase-like protein
MSVPVSTELRSEIIASIKGGTPIAEAAATHHLTPRTISKWMRQLSKNAQPTSSELQKARKQIAFLEQVVLGLVLEQKAQTYKG